MDYGDLEGEIVRRDDTGGVTYNVVVTDEQLAKSIRVPINWWVKPKGIVAVNNSPQKDLYGDYDRAMGIL